MNLTPELKAIIDAQSYEQLLRSWRFAEVGDPRFQGDVGKYWEKRIAEMRDNHPDPAEVSKSIGWTP